MSTNDDAKTADLLWIGLSAAKAKDTLKNEPLTKLLTELIGTLKKLTNETATLDRNLGKLVYQAATISKAQIQHHLPLVVEYIAQGKIRSEQQLTAAIEYLLSHPTNVVVDQFEKESGVNVVITQQDIANEVAKHVEKNKQELLEKRYHFNQGILITEARKVLKFADGKLVKAEVDKQVLELLGPKTEADSAKPGKKVKQAKQEETGKMPAKEDVVVASGSQDIIELLKKTNFHAVGENFKTDGYVITPSTMKLLANHVKVN